MEEYEVRVAVVNLLMLARDHLILATPKQGHRLIWQQFPCRPAQPGISLAAWRFALPQSVGSSVSIVSSFLFFMFALYLPYSVVQSKTFPPPHSNPGTLVCLHEACICPFRNLTYSTLSVMSPFPASVDVT